MGYQESSKIIYISQKEIDEKNRVTSSKLNEIRIILNNFVHNFAIFINQKIAIRIMLYDFE